MRRWILALPLVLMLLFPVSCTDEDSLTGPGGPHYQRVTHTIGAAHYLNNRFFRLDLPPVGVGYPFEGENEAGQVVAIRDVPGRNVLEEFIDPSSVRVFLNVSGQGAQPGDVDFVAAYRDTTGRWTTALVLSAEEPVVLRELWRPLSFEILLDSEGRLVALDLLQEHADGDVLAVIYDIVGDLGDPSGSLLYRVGDRPELGPPTVDVDGDGTNDYRMKLLKPLGRGPVTFHYVLRNIYPLGGCNLDYGSFDLQIVLNNQSLAHPELDLNGLPWIRIFGLDRMGPRDPFHNPESWQPDGEVDKFDPSRFDLQVGLLKFPPDMYHPFSMSAEYYAALADTAAFVWEQSYLSENRIPEIYDHRVNPTTYSQYERFQFQVSWLAPIEEEIDVPATISLRRQDWMWASLPAQGEDPGYVVATGDDRLFRPAARATAIRWFLPIERVVWRYLEPDMEILDVLHNGRETVRALQLFMRQDAGEWGPDTWGGIMQGLDPRGVDLTGHRYLDVWINDFHPEPADRRGAVHVDLGYISEDFYWPYDWDSGEPETLTFQFEDRNHDGIFVNSDEDTGLDGVFGGGDEFSADRGTDDNPFPRINGTEHNNREDSEDLDGDTAFDRRNGYFTWSFDLTDAAEIDVLRDYTGDRVNAMAEQGLAWRKYRLDLAAALTVSPQIRGADPDMSAVTHLRIWYEDASAAPPPAVHLQIAELRFVK